VVKADSKLLAFVLTNGAPVNLLLMHSHHITFCYLAISCALNRNLPRRSRTDGKDGIKIKWGINIAIPPKIHTHLVESFFTAKKERIR
jgi:hypothetical protein